MSAEETTTALPDVGDIVIQKLQESTAGTPEANRVDALLGEGGALFNAIQSIIKTETEKYKLKVLGLILGQCPEMVVMTRVFIFERCFCPTCKISGNTSKLL